MSRLVTNRFSLTNIVAFCLILSCITSFSNIGLVSASEAGPSPLYAHSMVHDPVNDQLILYGTRSLEQSAATAASTWLYHLSNNSWSSLSPTLSPGRQSNSGMVYDSSTQRVIYFGGGETWTFEPLSNSWSQLSPENSPPDLADFSLYYDSDAQKGVLFGGKDLSEVKSDATWIFDPQTNSWDQLSTNTPPQPRYGHAMVYDSTVQLGVLFGGRVSSLFSETWSLNLSAGIWQEISTNPTPLSRYWFAMVFDSNLGQSLMFGGDNEQSAIRALGDTWSFEGSSSSWTEFSPGSIPSPRTGHAMAFASSNNKTYLFGGLGEDYSVNYGDLWAFDSTDSEWTLLLEVNEGISYGFVFLGISIVTCAELLRKQKKTST